MQKLLDIEKDKNASGVSTIRKRLTKEDYRFPSEIHFSDGEEWLIVKPNDGARGYRWRKAWVDVKTSIEMLQNLILPCGALYQWENEKYFTWNKY
jgi:hypothetical protein